MCYDGATEDSPIETDAGTCIWNLNIDILNFSHDYCKRYTFAVLIETQL